MGSIKKCLFGISVFMLVFSLILTGCGKNNDDYQPPEKGLVTFNNVPNGYTLSYLEVSSLPVYNWNIVYNGNVDNPKNSTWCGSVIGYGQKQDYNTATVNSFSYKYENGVWDGQWNNQDDFNFTGSGSVYVTFNTADNITTPWSFGINNVQFSGGNAAINFAKVLTDAGGSGTFSAAKGKFTINNIPSGKNGKYVIAACTLNTSNVLWGMTNITGYPNDITYHLAKIENQSVSIPLYKVNASASTITDYFIPYEGSDSLGMPTPSFVVVIVNQGQLTMSNMSSEMTSAMSDPDNAGMFTSGTFSGGNMTKDWSDGSLIP